MRLLKIRALARSRYLNRGEKFANRTNTRITPSLSRPATPAPLPPTSSLIFRYPPRRQYSSLTLSRSQENYQSHTQVQDQPLQAVQALSYTDSPHFTRTSSPPPSSGIDVTTTTMERSERDPSDAAFRLANGWVKVTRQRRPLEALRSYPSHR